MAATPGACALSSSITSTVGSGPDCSGASGRDPFVWVMNVRMLPRSTCEAALERDVVVGGRACRWRQPREVVARRHGRFDVGRRRRRAPIDRGDDAEGLDALAAFDGLDAALLLVQVLGQ